MLKYEYNKSYFMCWIFIKQPVYGELTHIVVLINYHGPQNVILKFVNTR